MIHPSRLAVIERLVDELADGVVWALTGSAAHALRGRDVAVHDVDVITSASGAAEIERRFASLVVRPVRWAESDSIRSHFGALRIDDVDVELMGDVQTLDRNGAWRAPIEVDALRQFIALEGRAIPVMPLAHEIEFYEQLGRGERAAALRALVRAAST